MPYKNYNDRKKKSLEYYYNNKEKVLTYQKKRLEEKRKTDPNFIKKRAIRDQSRNKKGGGKDNLKNKSCEECGTNEDLQRHHENYKSLNIIILCRNCHNKLHNSLKGKNCNQSK